MFRSCVALAALAGVSALAVPAGAVVVRGQPEALLAWEPASGPVASYGVFVSKNGGEFPRYPSFWVPQPEFALRGEVGSEYVLRVAAYDNRGNRGPFSPDSEPIQFLGFPWPASDFDGDGRSEVLLVRVEGELGRYILLETDGRETLSSALILSDDPALTPVGVADFDGDGRSDLLLRDLESGRIAMSLDDLGASETVATLDLDWRVRGADDFDGDGRADILFEHLPTGTVGMWLMSGSDLLESGSVAAMLPDQEIVGTGRFAADGSVDILVWDPISGLAELWEQDGLEREAVSELAIEAPPEAIGSVGDFDGDGIDDVVWHERDTNGRLSFWLTAPEGEPDVTALSLLPPGWPIVAIGDYDGDHDDDLLIRDPASAALYTFLIGTGVTPEGFGNLRAAWSAWEVFSP